MTDEIKDEKIEPKAELVTEVLEEQKLEPVEKIDPIDISEIKGPEETAPVSPPDPVAEIQQIGNPSTSLGASKTIEKRGDTITITEVMQPKIEVSKATFDTLGQKFPAPYNQINLWQKFLEKLGVNKRKKLNKILAFLDKNQKITNDEIEKLLHVSDATATRYLDILEKEGKITQVGKTGRYTYYTNI